MSDIQIKLTEFSHLIERLASDFVGREWLVKQVDILLADPDCRFVILTGSAGVEKSAFMVHLPATIHSGHVTSFVETAVNFFTPAMTRLSSSRLGDSWPPSIQISSILRGGKLLSLNRLGIWR